METKINSANEIEFRFYQLAENNEMCDPWVAQWKLAKKRAPMILDVISHIFPHYSLHNVSHSEAILNNITMMVGKVAIEKLSVVDLWMLLNAAYYHDSGMVVDCEDKKNLFADGSKFVKFVKEKQEDTASPMNEYARHLEIKNDKLYYANNELTGKSYEAVRFLIAEFIRKAHAERSSKKIEDEFKESFPKGIISKRIIGQLSQICAAHMQNRETVMNLPFEQTSGCGTEPCHPRLVAYLLRLGDLLDVDNNRLSDVLLHSLGSIPVDSKDYNEINRSITLLNITRKTIEITAECHNYKIAELTNDWFKWLNDEVVFVSQHWHDIAPSNDFCMLPTIGKLEVNLKGYDTIDGKNRPVFKIDTGKAIEMIQGAGLYTNPALCMRELLQNAVDATHLRAFKEHPEIKEYHEYFEFLKKYPIKVVIEDKKQSKDKYECTVEIKDQGLGMSKQDLEYLFNTGSSSKNKEKRELIERMVDFMRPSGIFGIGFQSVFLVADQVELKTRKINREETYDVVLYNPSGKEKGSILMKTEKDDDVPVGTTIRFKTSHEAYSDISDMTEYNWGFPTFRQFYKELDFAKVDEGVEHTRFAGLIEEVLKYAERSSVPIELDYNGTIYNIDSKGVLEYFDEKESIAVEQISNITSEYCYRNQRVNEHSHNRNLAALNFKINILDGDAREWLTLNRESLKDLSEKGLNRKIDCAIARYLEFLKKKANEEQKQLISMALDSIKPSVGEMDDVKGVVTFDDLWMDIKLPFFYDKVDNIELTLREFLDMHEIKSCNSDGPYRWNFFEIKINGVSYVLKEFNRRLPYKSYNFIYRKLADHFKSVYFKDDEYMISKDEKADVYSDDEKTKLQLLKKYMSHHEMARDYFPCNEKYKALMVGERDEYYPISVKVPIMVCPYRRIPSKGAYEDAKELVYDVDEKVMAYVYMHRADQNVTREQIADAYEVFKSDFEQALNNVNRIK